jgi:hypothetical protein
VTWIEEQNSEPDVLITVKPIVNTRVIFTGEFEIESSEAIEKFRKIQQQAIERINKRFELLIVGRTM